MSKFHRDDTRASDPGRLQLSMAKLKKLQPELFGLRSFFVRFSWNKKSLGAKQTIEMIAEHMHSGDSRAAVVINEKPLVVAAYTDELDCVALLQFPDWLTDECSLKTGGRLLTVNTYGKRPRPSADLVPGPAALGRWTFFFPIIAEFVADSAQAITMRKQTISEQEWQKTWSMGQAKFRENPKLFRDGRPLHSRKPAKGR
jgi:hypothetical protein